MVLYIAKKEGNSMTIYKLLQLLRKAENKQIDMWEIEQLKYYTDEEAELILSLNNKREVKTLLKNTDFRSLPQEIQKEILKIIGNFNGNSSAIYYAVNIATNKNTINSGYLKEIIEIIIKLESEDKIILVSNIVTNTIALQHKDILKMLSAMEENQLTECPQFLVAYQCLLSHILQPTMPTIIFQVLQTN